MNKELSTRTDEQRFGDWAWGREGEGYSVRFSNGEMVISFNGDETLTLSEFLKREETDSL